MSNGIVNLKGFGIISRQHISFPIDSLIIAHRGASLYAPENTLAALKKAHELGARWVEFDVQLIASGEAVVIHDNRLNRTSDGKGWLACQRYQQLSQRDAGSWFDPAFHQERIPLLSDWLQCAAQLQLGLNIEIKPTWWNKKELVQKTLASIDQYWSAELPPVLISSSSPLVLIECHRLAPTIALGLVSHRWRHNWRSLLARCHCVSFHVNHHALTPKRISAVVDASYSLLTYTVNDATLASQLLAQGVCAVFSDNPLLLSDVETSDSSSDALS